MNQRIHDEIAAFAADVQAECNRRHRAHVCGELCFWWCIDAACLSDSEATECHKVIMAKRALNTRNEHPEPETVKQ